MIFRLIYDKKLAQAAYLIGCQQTGEAIVIDPQRDIERYIKQAEQEGVKISAIAETHIHADFLSGARELAEKTGARVYLSCEGGPGWQYQWLDKKQGGGSYEHQLLKDGDVFNIGNIEFKAVHTPGHTPEHLSYLVTDRGGGATDPMGIASGDFVFVGDVGRPDLLETAAGQTGASETSAKQLFDSIHTFNELPDYLQLWPGHGAGSACGKALGAVPQSTVGYEKRYNAAISLATNESKFIEAILYGQPEPPYYFARMKKENREGPAILDSVPQPEKISLSKLDSLIEQKVAFIDTRPWSDFIQGHLATAIFAPLNTAFPTIVGSYIEPDKSIYLIVEKENLQEAVIDLIHIGFDEIVGYITPGVLTEYFSKNSKPLLTKYMEITEINDLVNDPNVQILDVRRADEFAAGKLPNAINIAHTRLLPQLDDLPKNKRLLVYCHSGGRSAYATAMLESHGFDATQLDGGFTAWHKPAARL